MGLELALLAVVAWIAGCVRVAIWERAMMREADRQIRAAEFKREHDAMMRALRRTNRLSRLSTKRAS